LKNALFYSGLTSILAPTIARNNNTSIRLLGMLGACLDHAGNIQQLLF
jgi:hypothetical protein